MSLGGMVFSLLTLALAIIPAANAQTTCSYQSTEVPCILQAWTSAPPDSEGQILFRLTYAWDAPENDVGRHLQKLTIRVPSKLETSVIKFVEQYPTQHCVVELRQTDDDACSVVGSRVMKPPQALREHVVPEPNTDETPNP